MKIELKCRCGAEIVVDDPERCYAGGEGRSKIEDKHGRRYMAQVIADDWLERHQGCMNCAETERKED